MKALGNIIFVTGFFSLLAYLVIAFVACMVSYDLKFLDIEEWDQGGRFIFALACLASLAYGVYDVTKQ